MAQDRNRKKKKSQRFLPFLFLTLLQMGSRILNFFANKWSSPTKNQLADTEMSGVTTPVTVTDTSLEEAASSTHHESSSNSSPPTSPAAGSAMSVQQDGKMESSAGEIEQETELEKSDATAEVAKNDGQDDEEDEDEDTEGMDMKAKALTKLLQTSSVSWKASRSTCLLLFMCRVLFIHTN